MCLLFLLHLQQYKFSVKFMDLSKNYMPAAVEEKWYKHWVSKNYFKSVPDERPAYTVVIPPPNVTGVLHMGHTLNETVQDILVRKARMTGFNACWVPGSDHASIATEAKVVDMLKREKNIDLIQNKGSYTDENGDYWINYTGVDEDGDKCGVSLKIFKKSESYNSHIATLFIEYVDFKLVFRLKKDD